MVETSIYQIDAEVLAFCKDDRRMVGLLAKAWTREGDRWIGRR